MVLEPGQRAPGAEGHSMSGRPSLRAAVNAQCRDCVYDPSQPGSWLDQVANCCGYSCPLYPVRPGADRQPERLNTGQKTALTVETMSATA